MQRQILATLAYSDVFSFPLLAKEIFQRLMTSAVINNAIPHEAQLKKDQEITFGDVKKELKVLLAEKKVTEVDGYFSIRSKKETQSLVVERIRKESIAVKKWQEAHYAVGLLQHIPGIVGIAITGSLAVNNPASETDDIDFLVVTQPNCLWIVRPLVILVAFVCGKRRSWQGEEQNSWCFNAWMTTESLTLSKIYPEFEPNVYHAYELLQATWLLNRGVSLLDANPWVSWFVSLQRWFDGKVRKVKKINNQSNSLWERFVAGVNYLCYKAQLRYMKPHMTTERVTYDVAFFHPRPTKSRTTNSLVKTYTKIQEGNVVLTPWFLPARLQKRLEQARKENTTIVLVTGVFDIFHKEHKKFLEKAKQAGDLLVVGIESDSRVRTVKGEGRPVNTLEKRLTQIRALPWVDEVFALPETFSSPADHDALIASIKPALLAVSSHTAHLDKKQAILQKHGGDVKVVHQHNPKVSTTLLLQTRN